MTTPHAHARLVLARRTATDLLDQWGTPDPDRKAAQLIDALQNAGWGPPRDITHLPGHGTQSTAAARAAVLAHTRACIAAARAARIDTEAEATT